MKKIIYALKDHLVHGFRWQFFFFLCIYLAVWIIINYAFDLENTIIDKHYGKNIRILYYLLLYGAAYYPVSITYALVYKDPVILRKGFWIKSAIALIIISFDRAFHYHADLIRELLDPPHTYWMRTFYLFKKVLTILLPLLVLYCLYRENKIGFYGLTTRNFDWKPFSLMLLVMAPIIAIISFEPGFYEYYPRFKNDGIPGYISTGWAAFIYESVYGLNFVSIELIFRGFLILGIMKYLGKGSVFPMVAVYCFYHFGKPWGEAVSSIIGGYILGVISLYTRSVIRGIVVHVGIAWMMEFTAALQKNMFSSA